MVFSKMTKEVSLKYQRLEKRKNWVDKKIAELKKLTQKIKNNLLFKTDLEKLTIYLIAKNMFCN